VCRRHQYEPAGFGDSLAVGLEAACDALAIRNEFRANGQRVHHARFAARLFVVRLARYRRKSETNQNERNDSAHFHRRTPDQVLAGRRPGKQKVCRFEAVSFSQERNEKRLYKRRRRFQEPYFSGV
jgi:hypothetical protein